MKVSEALEISRKIAEDVEKAVNRIAGSREAGVTVAMGKDGTPTKKIDRIAEDIALKILREHDLKIITEESGVVGDGETIVALDPLDGTFNASRGIPFYSIALCFSKTEALGGMFFAYVRDLASGTEYHSDGKSYRNGERIKVSETDDVRCNAIIYYPDRIYPFRRIRVFGSSALEICMVADGTFDCFIDIRKDGNGRGYLRVFDISASLFIARNAGAEISSLDGDDLWKKRFTMDERFRILVSGKNLHEKLLDVL